MPGEFYLYRIFHADMTLYIGKGSGNRLQKQKRAFGVEGEVIARFDREDEAYAEEVRLIALHEPPLNRHPGGMGGRSGCYQAPVLPHGFTPEGLRFAAPYLSKLLLVWMSDKSLGGLLKIIGAYHEAHGFDALAEAVVPHLKRILFNNLTIENSRAV